MNRSTHHFIVAACLTVTSIAATLPAQAQNAVTFRFTGIITSVDDANNVFQNTYALGAAISGTYTFSDSGFSNGFYQADPNVHLYENFAHGKFSIRSGAQPAISGTNQVSITVGNDTTAAVVPAGDTYSAQALFDFPSFFRDPTGDPNFDPNGFFLPYLFGKINLYDPTGTALPSFDLPLTPPNPAAFSQRTGRIILFDGNGELPDAAQMGFSIDTLRLANAAPEPGSLGLLALGVVGIAWRRKGR